MAQRGDEGLRTPMAKRRFHLQSLAPARTAAKPGHLRRGAGFIDKDQPFGALLHPGLAVCRPYPPSSNDISTTGFAGQQRFF